MFQQQCCVFVFALNPQAPLSLSLPVPCDSVLACGLHHVVADHGVVVEDHGVVGLDEAHATHVCCQVEHVVAALTHLLAVVKQAQVHKVELVAKLVLLMVEMTGTSRQGEKVVVCGAIVAANRIAAVCGGCEADHTNINAWALNCPLQARCCVLP